MLCMCIRSCVLANDLQIMRSRDAQCNTEESPLGVKLESNNPKK